MICVLLDKLDKYSDAFSIRVSLKLYKLASQPSSSLTCLFALIRVYHRRFVLLNNIASEIKISGDPITVFLPLTSTGTFTEKKCSALICFLVGILKHTQAKRKCILLT